MEGNSFERDEEVRFWKLYSALRAMHWSDGKLAVVRAKDLPLGVQTYSGDLLDEAIREHQEEVRDA